MMEVMELTREAFEQEIKELTEQGKKFNVESEDSYGLYISMFDCEIHFGEDMDDEIKVHKPNTLMEINFYYEYIESITKDENGTYHFEFTLGMADVLIEVAE